MQGALEPPAPAKAGPGTRPSAVTARDLARATATRRRRSASLKLWTGAVCTLLVVVPVALAQVLPLPGAGDQDLSRRRLAPLTDGHLFGTDQLGRDVLSRVLHGGQVSLTVGVLAVVVSGLIGIVAGAAAGYYGRWVDAVVSRLLEAQMSLPLLMMLLLVVALFGPSVTVITCVIAIAQWPEVARLTRSLVLVEREKPYVAAAQVLGLPRIAILARHVIPNIVRQASLVVLLLLAQAVLLESALSYLGAGPQRPFATWGRIISDGQDYITTSWWLVTLPGLVIVLLVVGVNLLGDGLRDRTRRRTTEGSR
ncbi:ABC transporter permease [Streptomyces rapamycinicus]|uniref:ABC transporter permease n=2 Tax=Streptomyces rapamycinicus TaxID=1226757 RepID=A0A0A0N8P5_STRRN|nr:ABC transporter permease [Streptomyces rapamycinicus]AGP53124.1 ABC transporter permease [Streptomyces rapamycinicus NRRL 5491]MBB4780606.1 peptide/nickel transport system permease protein [Streptomyces rapamycinicus]RLV74743.1 ABC transporter permease [Streptomyces rapamycinicus NRRL 5491]UTO61319.1 ABC transporter permease [Streptomyces rapamycinicus]UTP29266.1 ABC transporter permease [Streptomyces rapamycinicus NRRL 5491]